MDNFPIDADGVEERILDPRAHEPDIDDLRGRLDSINPNFCPNPCCIQAFCPQHCMFLSELTAPYFGHTDWSSIANSSCPANRASCY